jgi:hypothetical protein
MYVVGPVWNLGFVLVVEKLIVANLFSVSEKSLKFFAEAGKSK